MSKLYNLSICVTDLANLPDDAVKKASNGKYYLNVSLWINEEEDKYGNVGSISFDQKIEGGYEHNYIGNIRPVKSKVQTEDEKDSKTWKEHLAL